MKKGSKHSEDAKAKMREAARSRPPTSAMTKRIMSEAKQDRKLPPEHIEKLKAAWVERKARKLDKS